MNKELNAAEAVYGFVGWLTTREERTVMSAKDDCAPIAELIKRFCTENNLPEVSDQWPLNLIHPSGEVAVPNAAGMGDPLVTAAPAAVAGPSEAVKFTDQSTAAPVEKARRYLTAMGDQRTNSAYFYDDGYPRRESAANLS